MYVGQKNGKETLYRIPKTIQLLYTYTNVFIYLVKNL